MTSSVLFSQAVFQHDFHSSDMYHNKQDDKTTQIRSGTISLHWQNIGISHVGRVNRAN